MKVRREYTFWLALTCLITTLLCQSVIAYSDPLEINPTQVKESTSQLLDTPVMLSENLPTMVRASAPLARKHTLNEDSRGLSAFLGIGIGINVIMAILFTWWFSTEWRKKNKSGQSKHDDK